MHFYNNEKISHFRHNLLYNNKINSLLVSKNQRMLKMNFVKLIVQISFLYLLFFIGNIIQQQFHLIIPGSIIGMLLLFCLLFIPFFKGNWIRNGSNFLSKHLTLLFIPATVGIMNYSSILNFHGLISIIIVLVSTAVVFSITASISSYLTSRAHKKQTNDLLIGRDTNEGH